VPTARIKVTTYISAETDRALRARAVADERTVSSTLERILRHTLLPTTSETARRGGSATTKRVGPRHVAA
jgi:hypothetical protein